MIRDVVSLVVRDMSVVVGDGESVVVEDKV